MKEENLGRGSWASCVRVLAPAFKGYTILSEPLSIQLGDHSNLS